MKRPASLVVGILLLFLACAQLCRFFLKVNVVAAGMEIPRLAQRGCRCSSGRSGCLASERKKQLKITSKEVKSSLYHFERR